MLFKIYNFLIPSFPYIPSFRDSCSCVFFQQSFSIGMLKNTLSFLVIMLHYSYLVTNTGNVTLSGPFTVTDDRSTDETCPATATLAPGASIICMATYTVTQADLDAGSVTNIASAHGTFSGNPVTSPTDSETVPATQTPALSIVKSVTETSYAAVGDVLHYSYLITNTGNVTLSGPFTVTDDRSTDETCPATATLASGSAARHATAHAHAASAQAAGITVDNETTRGPGRTLLPEYVPAAPSSNLRHHSATASCPSHVPSPHNTTIS